MTYSEEEILQVVREEIADCLKIPLEEVKPDSVLTDDLDAMSIDFMDILFRLETKFVVRFHSGNPLDEIGEAMKPDALSQKGLLTDLGVEVVRQRMPEIDGSRVVREMPVGGVQALYTTRTWVRAVKELLDAQPTSCPYCDDSNLEPLRPSVLQCRACKREVQTPTQRELLIAWAADRDDLASTHAGNSS